jgi:lipopolysaccharide transport system permease protein
MKEYEITYPYRRRLALREWWHYRELFWFLAWRDIKVKYKQTLLGIIWAVLQPLALMILFTVFWKKAVNIELDAPYPVFVYSGLMVWGLFSSGIGNAGSSMISNANIIKKVYFPRFIIPVAAILVSLVDFVATLVPYAALLAFYNMPVQITPFLACSALCLLTVLPATLGIGLLIAAVNIRYRDARYAVPFLVQALFFATPVIFPLAAIKAKNLLFVLSLNPISAAVNFARAAVALEPVNWPLSGLGMAVSFVLLAAGLIFFEKNEIECADIL